MNAEDLPEDDLEFEKQWSAIASERSAWAGAMNHANEAAARAFIADRHDEANALKRLAKTFAEIERGKSADLQLFIDESKKRRTS